MTYSRKRFSGSTVSVDNNKSDRSPSPFPIKNKVGSLQQTWVSAMRRRVASTGLGLKPRGEEEEEVERSDEASPPLPRAGDAARQIGKSGARSVCTLACTQIAS